MAKGSENPFPKVLFDEQASDIATPAADRWVMFAKAGGIYARNAAGTVVGPFAAAASPTFIGVKVYKAASITNTDSNRVTLTWDGEDADTHAFHSTVSNPDRLTVPSGQAGWYVPFINLSYGGHATGYRDIQICKNGTAIIVGNDRRPGHTGDNDFAQTFPPVQLAEADYLIARWFQNSGTTLTLYGDNDFTDPVFAPRFGMYRVG